MAAAFGPQIAPMDMLTGELVAVEPLDGCRGSGAGGDAVIPDGTRPDYMQRIALMQRGNCSFSSKAFFAQSHGATAAVIMGDVPHRPLLRMGAAPDDPYAKHIRIPSVFVTYESGSRLLSLLRQHTPVTVTLYPDNASAMKKFLARFITLSVSALVLFISGFMITVGLMHHRRRGYRAVLDATKRIAWLRDRCTVRAVQRGLRAADRLAGRSRSALRTRSYRPAHRLIRPAMHPSTATVTTTRAPSAWSPCPQAPPPPCSGCRVRATTAFTSDASWRGSKPMCRRALSVRWTYMTHRQRRRWTLTPCEACRGATPCPP